MMLQPLPFMPQPSSSKVPRYYQDEAEEAIWRTFAEQQSALLVLATGLGKTFVFSRVAKKAREMGWNILCLAHTGELVEQNRKTLEEVLGETVYVEQAELQAPPYAGLVSGSFQSITQERRLQRLGKNRFQLIIADEAHRSLAPSFLRVLEFFQAKRLGVTATPDRGDERALGKVYDEVAYVMDILDGIDAGFLVPLEARNVHVEELDISKVREHAGKLNEGELDKAVLEGVEGIVKETLRLEPNRYGINFWPGVLSAEAAHHLFEKLRPGSSCFLHGGTDPDERRKIVADFRAKKYQFMNQCLVAVEGFDAPHVDLIVWARPCKSRWMFAQGVGRGMRTLPGTVDDLPEEHQAAARKMRIAMSAKPNCIAEGQRVLTDHGLVPIERVTLEMKVWDGSCFVSHGGAILRGESEVIRYAGLEATADHSVWTKEGWKTLGECASEQVPVAVTGFGGQAVRATSGLFRNSPEEEWAPVHPGHVLGVWPDIDTRALQPGFWESWMHKVRETTAGPEVAGVQVLGSVREVSEPKSQVLREVRWPGDRVSLLERDRDGGLGHGKPRTGPRSSAGQNRERRALRAGELAPVNTGPKLRTHEKAAPHCTHARISLSTPRGQICRRHAQEDGRKHDLRADSGAVPPQVDKAERRVWDILDAGPLHRFTVEGLLVHNCTLLNFVGNAGAHSLVTPEDILGGDFTEPELKEAKRLAETQQGDETYDPLEALKASRQWLQGLAAKATSQFTSVVTAFDPFKMLDVDLGDDRIGQRYGVHPPTEKQIVMLKGRGVEDDAIRTLDRRGASKLIDSLKQRQEAGLASLKQMRFLAKYGVTDNTVTFEAANKGITYIKGKGWGKRGIDPSVLNQLLGRE